MTCQQIMRMARRDGWDKSKWDLLCMNCNFAKGHYGGCPHKTGVTTEQAIQRMRDRNLKIGRKHIDPRTNGSQVGFMRPGFDERRMQLHRRVLKPCPYCWLEFGTNEMTRHKRAEHDNCRMIGGKPHELIGDEWFEIEKRTTRTEMYTDPIRHTVHIREIPL